MSGTPFSSLRCFFSCFVRDRDRVGSVVPSSRRLARALAQCALDDASAEDLRIIEVGPGTGTTTRALLEKFNTIELIEREEKFVSFIQDKFKNVPVHNGCVADILPEILANGNAGVLVSSVPLLGNPDAEKIKAVYRKFLEEGRIKKIVQYTYGLSCPYGDASGTFQVKRRKLVFLNFPPAFIWTMELRPGVKPQKSKQLHEALAH